MEDPDGIEEAFKYEPNIEWSSVNLTRNLLNLTANMTLNDPSSTSSTSSSIYSSPTPTTNSTEELLENELYEVPTGIVVLLSIFYGSISLVAVVGNALVIWIVATSRKMHSVTNYFIANLALADIIIGLFAIPFQVRFFFFLPSSSSSSTYSSSSFSFPSST